jgi:hypothetical protein
MGARHGDGAQPAGRVALDFLPGQAPLAVAGPGVHAPIIGQGLGGLQGLGLAGDAVRGGGRQG